MTSVLLVDDHELVRLGLRHVLEHVNGFEVVGAVRTVRAAVLGVSNRRADVAVVGSWLSDRTALDAAEQLRQAHPRVGIVVLTSLDDDEHRLRALEHGASSTVRPQRDGGGDRRRDAAAADEPVRRGARRAGRARPGARPARRPSRAAPPALSP